MGIFRKDSGLFKETVPYGNIGGTWKAPVEGWVKQNGEWRTSFSAAGYIPEKLGESAVPGTFGTGFNNAVESIAVQSDGKMLIGGDFTLFNGNTRNRLVRLNADGTEDTSFSNNLGTGFNNTVESIAVQSDGKILVVGEFSSFKGNTRSYIVRLNSNGTEDTTFYNNLGTGFNGSIYSVAIQPDGKIILSGRFNGFNQTIRRGLLRLNSNGTEDTTFSFGYGFSSTSLYAKSIAIQSDGKIILGGNFNSFDQTTRGRIVRLNSNGLQDNTFSTNLGAGFDSDVESIAIQSDGKILVGGNFSTLSGSSRGELARLNSNGAPDTTFNNNLPNSFQARIFSVAVQSNGRILIGGFINELPGGLSGFIGLNSSGTYDTTFNNALGEGLGTPVYSIAVKGDDSVVVGGNFNSFDNNPAPRIAILNSNGSIGFTPKVIAGFSSNVNSIATQSDNKILVGGAFTSFNGNTRNRLVRLNADGTEDTSFSNNLGTGFVGTVESIAVQSDGKILVVGGFFSLNGTTRNRIVRLNSDGTVDTAFSSNLGSAFNSTALSVAVQSDGKILVGGYFTFVNGTSRNRLVRLNSNGTVDTAFSSNLGSAFSGAPRSITVQSDGKILVGGEFTFVNGTSRNRLVRLNSNGTVDTAFSSNLGSAFNSTAWVTAIQSDNKILVGGAFTSFNGNTRNRLVRLNADGTEDTTFYSNLGSGFNSNVNSIAVQSDGKMLVGGQFSALNGTSRNRLVRLNSNGTVDTAFATSLGTGFSSTVNSIVIQSDIRMLVGGAFVVVNGTSISERFTMVGLSTY